jgi:hypothetical protein
LDLFILNVDTGKIGHVENVPPSGTTTTTLSTLGGVTLGQAAWHPSSSSCQGVATTTPIERIHTIDIIVYVFRVDGCPHCQNRKASMATRCNLKSVTARPTIKGVLVAKGLSDYAQLLSELAITKWYRHPMLCPRTWPSSISQR